MRLRTPARSTLVLVAGLLLLCGRADAADRQIRPFIGATFGGGDDVRGSRRTRPASRNPAIGVSAVFLGELFGAEVDVADAPGFFESGDKHLVLNSRVTTSAATWWWRRRTGSRSIRCGRTSWRAAG